MTYPYFAYDALMELRKTSDKAERDRLRRIVAVNIGNPDVLCEILGLNTESLADFYPDSLPRLSTIDTIDTFISTYGGDTPIAPTTADYLRDEPSDASPSDDPTFSAIDAFLKSVPPPQPKRPQPMEKTEETPALTESFAKILIKNQNYTKALQIIQELNLKNPEKSVYFADQIRFLKKLIINQSKRMQ